jgi:FixJ family two-component response regulator
MARQRQCFVAVVDDDAGVRLALQGLLHSHGLKVRCFASAEQFLQARDRIRAGCLLLDLQLAGMSGLDLLRQLRAAGRHIPAVCLTAQYDEDGRLRAQLLEAGALEVLGKPFDPEQLLTLVHAALRSVAPP